jgi:hypothetical protein
VTAPGAHQKLPYRERREGFSLNADPGRISLARINTGENIPGESKVFPYKEHERFVFEGRDTVSVGNKIENRPVVFFKGAVSAVVKGNVEKTSAEIEGTALLEYPLRGRNSGECRKGDP